MKKVFTLVLAAALTGVFSGGSAGAQSGTVIVAGPDSQTLGFATPIVFVHPGDPITFASADIMGHDVVTTNDTCSNGAVKCASAYGPSTQPWCYLYAPGPCPLLWSEYLSVGVTPVLGSENLVPGEIYRFRCEPHNAMFGYVVVLS